MELKDAILSTLAEIESHEKKSEKTISQDSKDQEIVSAVNEIEKKIEILKKREESNHTSQKESKKSKTNQGDEAIFLEELRERMLVLFEGFQSPNNTQIEAKVDLTLNFLEYLLATIDDRLEKIK